MATKIPMRMMRSGWKLYRRSFGKKPQRTPGRDKGETCTTNPRKKYFACNPKAQYDPQYKAWNDKFRQMNSNKAA